MPRHGIRGGGGGGGACYLFCPRRRGLAPLTRGGDQSPTLGLMFQARAAGFLSGFFLVFIVFLLFLKTIEVFTRISIV